MVDFNIADPNQRSLKSSYYYSDAQVLAGYEPNAVDPNYCDLYFYLHDRLGSVRQVAGE